MIGHRTRLILAACLTIGVAAIAYNGVQTWRHIPQAYAAWDAGTLLVAYMQAHDNRWPASWDDLLTVLDSPENNPIRLRGGDSQEAALRSLRTNVAIDWTFQPQLDLPRISLHYPVSTPRGYAFRTVWTGVEPNQMVRAYLESGTGGPPTP